MTQDTAADQRQHQLSQEEAEIDFVLAARILAANVMRIARGAGAGHRLAGEMQDLLAALANYREIFGRVPDDTDWRIALNSEQSWEERYPRPRPDFSKNDAAAWAAVADHELEIVLKAALQVQSSRLLKQPPQAATGRRDLLNGIKLYNEACERIGSLSTS